MTWRNMFEDRDSFNPSRDAKVPLRRTPLSIIVRGALLLGNLTFSRHPFDALVRLRSMAAPKRALSYPVPWLTFGAIRTISARLSTESMVFEYGAGHSTLYWAKLGARVFSVEGNEQWYDILKAFLDAHPDYQIQLFFETEKARYIEAIEKAHVGSFDVVIIDGAHRRACVQAAVSFVKPGGLLVVDNTDWHWLEQRPLGGIPHEWVKSVYNGYAPMLGHRSETTIWQRPASSSNV